MQYKKTATHFFDWRTVPLSFPKGLTCARECKRERGDAVGSALKRNSMLTSGTTNVRKPRRHEPTFQKTCMSSTFYWPMRWSCHSKADQILYGLRTKALIITTLQTWLMSSARKHLWIQTKLLKKKKFLKWWPVFSYMLYCLYVEVRITLCILKSWTLYKG